MSPAPDAPSPDEQRRIDEIADAIRALDTPAPAGLRERVEAMAAGASDADHGAVDSDRGASDAIAARLAHGVALASRSPAAC